MVSDAPSPRFGITLIGVDNYATHCAFRVRFSICDLVGKDARPTYGSGFAVASPCLAVNAPGRTGVGRTGVGTFIISDECPLRVLRL